MKYFSPSKLIKIKKRSIILSVIIWGNRHANTVVVEIVTNFLRLIWLHISKSFQLFIL